MSTRVPDCARESGLAGTSAHRLSYTSRRCMVFVEHALIAMTQRRKGTKPMAGDALGIHTHPRPQLGVEISRAPSRTGQPLKVIGKENTTTRHRF